jgi:carbon-monoxide dehydrogenase iron sulfur subunit
MRKVIAVDIGRCLACKSCEIACAVAHSASGRLEEAAVEQPKPQKRVTVEAAGEFAVPMQCRHCEDAPCIAVCPTGAIYRHKADTPVLIEQARCIGCKYCIVVCPFGVIDAESRGKAVVKCDFCIERSKAGKEPACVEACPTKALKLVGEKELTADKRRLAAQQLACQAYGGLVVSVQNLAPASLDWAQARPEQGRGDGPVAGVASATARCAGRGAGAEAKQENPQ